MNLAALGAALSAFAVCVSSAVAFLVYRANRADKEETGKREDRALEWNIMEGTIETLRTSLADATTETHQLKQSLAEARRDCGRLRAEINVALANVAVLSDHIRRHVPDDVPFPRLRRMPNGNG